MNRGNYKQEHDRADYDWYVEPPRAVEQVLAEIDFGNDLIWDPCCGRGTILDVASTWGHPTFGSDIIDRHARHKFQRGNILTQIAKMPTRPGRATSVFSNLPFSYEQDIAEKIISHVLDTYPVRIAAFILPISFLAGQNRWKRMLRKGRPRPSKLLIYTERHSMPPGHLMNEMAARGGTMDYICLVYTHPHRWRTETVWLAPGARVPRANAHNPGEANA